VFFPLLLKKHLADACGFRLAERDVEILKHIEGFLVCDPFAGDPLAGSGESSEQLVHPWERVQERVSSVLLERRVREYWGNLGALQAGVTSPSGEATEASKGGRIGSDSLGCGVHDGTDEGGS
jgi:hypothetical protein